MFYVACVYCSVRSLFLSKYSRCCLEVNVELTWASEQFKYIAIQTLTSVFYIPLTGEISITCLSFKPELQKMRT